MGGTVFRTPLSPLRLQDRISFLLGLLFMVLLVSCGSSDGGASSSGGGGSSSGGDDPQVPSFTSGGNVIGEEDTASSFSGWASDIQNGTLFELTPEDPSLFLTGPVLDGFGALSFFPAADINGGTDVTVVLHGAGGGTTAPVTFHVDIVAVNDAPSFQVGANVSIEAATGSHFFSHWATELSPGPENESSQELAFIVESVTNSDLFLVPPVVDSANGNLYLVLDPSTAGEATVTLHLEDDGGLSGLGAENASESDSFTITVTDTQDPTAEILYPPDGAKTDAPTINVRGTAEDGVAVSFVRVSGQLAETGDGYATWAVDDFPVGPATSLLAQVSDAAGNYVGAADSLEVLGGQKLPIRPTTLAFDSSRGRLIFYSTAYEALLSYDPTSGTVVFFSQPTEGSPWTVSDLTYNSAPPALYALDTQEDRVLAFDLNTGAMSVVSSNLVGNGPNFHNLTSITAIQGGGGSPPSIVVTDTSFGSDNTPAVVSVSLTSGNRTVISANAPGGALVGSGTGSGPEFENPAGIFYQHSHFRFLVTDSSLKTLFAVNRASGNREILMGPDDSTDGSNIGIPTEVLLSSNGSTAWLLDPTTKKIFAVNMATGTYSILSSNNTHAGADGQRWSLPRDFTRAAGIGIFVADFGGHAVYSVSTSTGNRTREIDYMAGSGPAWTNPTSVSIDEQAQVALISCKGSDAIYTASLRDGSRTLVTGDGTGSGTIMVDPQTVVLLNANTLIVTDRGAEQPRVLAVNRASGLRTLISGQGMGGGVSFNDADDLVVDSNTNSAYVLDLFDETVTHVNLATGARSRVAGGGVGLGTPIDNPVAIEWDENTAQLLLLQNDTLLTIDPVSLARNTLLNLGDAGVVVEEGCRITCPPGGDHALISLISPLSLIEVSLSTGAISLLADLTSISGPPLDDVADIASSSVRQTIYLLSADSASLHAVDKTGSEQVLFSRD